MTVLNKKSFGGGRIRWLELVTIEKKGDGDEEPTPRNGLGAIFHDSHSYQDGMLGRWGISL